MLDKKQTIKRLLYDIVLFARVASGIRLRKYQQEAARAIVDSVLGNKGYSFVIIFPRQSGKNELQAQIEAYLLTLFALTNAELVKVSPTWKPQSLNAMRRLERVLSENRLVGELWVKESGYIYRIGTARIFFLSGAPAAHVVGATASTLLACDEAQDVPIAKWDKEIAPMAASTNATRVFWGTAWTSQTLLAREKRACLKAQAQDGVRRVFEITADDVRSEVPAYGAFVDAQIAMLGRNHPFVKTQFFSEEIDGQSGMFPPERISLMKGEHSSRSEPVEGALYAFLLDVAGEDENARGLDVDTETVTDLQNPGRDATALTIVEVDLAPMADDLIRAPRYLVIGRRLWVGARHAVLYSRLKALIERWQPRRIVVDATGVGAGLASFLEKAFPQRVLPFLFTAKSKSTLGWDFLSVIETGRYKEHRNPTQEQSLFWRQIAACQMEILGGAEHRMRWGVPDGRRCPQSGEVLHDDLVISASMVALLDEQKWGTAESTIIQGRDPLADLKPVF